jgi:hypothetical protein
MVWVRAIQYWMSDMAEMIRVPSIQLPWHHSIIDLGISPGDELMTWSTSEVAVCCSSASLACRRASASCRCASSA